MRELAAEGLIEVGRYQPNGARAYRITEKGRQRIAGLNDAAELICLVLDPDHDQITGALRGAHE